MPDLSDAHQNPLNVPLYSELWLWRLREECSLTECTSQPLLIKVWIKAWQLVSIQEQKNKYTGGEMRI